MKGKQVYLVKFKCKHGCPKFEVEVDYGHFIYFEKGVDCEIHKERPGREDIPVREVVCPRCGCVGGLEMEEELPF